MRKNIDRDTEKVLEMLRLLPSDLGFVEKKRDSLHRIINNSGNNVMKADEWISKFKNDLFLSTADPTSPNEAWVSGWVIPVHPTTSISGYLANDIDDFTNDVITRIEYSESVQPSGIVSGLIGCSYGFDWDDSEYYFTVSGSDLIYTYPSGLLEDYTTESYTLSKQDYDFTGSDEYLQISGVTTNLYIGELEHEPVDGTLSVIDVGNLEDPNDPDSDGITISDSDYTVNGNYVSFTAPRSDYIASGTIREEYTDPATGEMEYVYPSGYQPDEGYGSTYIVEYWYHSRGNPRFLSQREKREDMGLIGFPSATIEN